MPAGRSRAQNGAICVMRTVAVKVLWLSLATTVTSSVVGNATLRGGDASASAESDFHRWSSRRRALLASLCTESAIGVSNRCQRDLQVYCEALEEKQPPIWAMRMFDSTTKTADGVLWGNLVHLGNFEECVDVRAVEGGSGTSFDGQHCLVAYSRNHERAAGRSLALSWVHSLLSQLEDSEAIIEVAWCTPSSCDTDDILALARAGSEASDLAVEVAANKCHTHRRPALQNVDIAAMCVLLFFVLLAIASTVYDVWSLEKDSRERALISFSVISNWRKLIAVTTDDDKIRCINGVLALSVAWIVLGNTMAYYSAQVPSINSFYINDYVRELKRTGIVNTYVAVDTLLLVSGLLLCYLFLKEVEKTGKFNVGMFYIFRYLRMTLPLGVMVLLSVSLLNHAGSGPLWDSRHDEIRENCEKNWWLTLLYVNNYINVHNRCLTQSLYLSMDMQLYWVSPLVLLVLWKLQLLAKVWIGVLFIAGLAAPFSIVYLMKIGAGSRVMSNEENDKYIKHYQAPTYTRFSAWLVGVVLGYMLHHERKTKTKLSLATTVSCWAMAAVLLVASVHFLHPFQRSGYSYDPLEAAFYLTLHRPAWAVGVAWVIYACDRGYGGIVNTILSWNFFRPLSRLSYGMYLTHMSVIHLFAGSARTPIYLSDVTTIQTFLGVLIMSIAWAIPLTLFVETPVTAFRKAMSEEEEEKVVGDLPPDLRSPMPFRKPTIMRQLPEMVQINDSAEGPDAGIEYDERL